MLYKILENEKADFHIRHYCLESLGEVMSNYKTDENIALQILLDKEKLNEVNVLTETFKMK